MPPSVLPARSAQPLQLQDILDIQEEIDRNASEIARAYGQTDAALMIEAWLVGRGGSTDETGARM